MLDKVWQGSCDYWQSLFIQQHILAIGSTAWGGFLTKGRGIVSCEVYLPNTPINWRIDLVQHHLQFIPQSQVWGNLHQLEPEAIPSIQQTVTTYDPHQEVILLMVGGGQLEIYLLQNMVILPTDCYAQVQRRDEFQLGITAPRRNE